MATSMMSFMILDDGKCCSGHLRVKRISFCLYYENALRIYIQLTPLSRLFRRELFFFFFFLLFPDHSNAISSTTLCIFRNKISQVTIRWYYFNRQNLLVQFHQKRKQKRKKYGNNSCCSLHQIQSLTQSLICFQFFRHANSNLIASYRNGGTSFSITFLSYSAFIFCVFFFFLANITQRFWRLICATTAQFDVELNQVPSDVFDVPELEQEPTERTVEQQSNATHSPHFQRSETERNMGKSAFVWMRLLVICSLRNQTIEKAPIENIAERRLKYFYFFCWRGKMTYIVVLPILQRRTGLVTEFVLWTKEKNDCCCPLRARTWIWFNSARLHNVTNSFPKLVVAFRRLCRLCVTYSNWIQRKKPHPHFFFRLNSNIISSSHLLSSYLFWEIVYFFLGLFLGNNFSYKHLIRVKNTRCSLFSLLNPWLCSIFKWIFNYQANGKFKKKEDTQTFNQHYLHAIITCCARKLKTRDITVIIYGFM